MRAPALRPEPSVARPPLAAAAPVRRSSLPAAYIFAVAVYITVGIPSCRTVVDPVPDVDTRNDQIEALRILSAGNTIIVVLMGAVLVLQASGFSPVSSFHPDPTLPPLPRYSTYPATFLLYVPRPLALLSFRSGNASDSRLTRLLPLAPPLSRPNARRWPPPLPAIHYAGCPHPFPE